MARRITPEEKARIQALRDAKQQPRVSQFYGIHQVVHEYLKVPRWVPLDKVCYLEHGINYNYQQPDARLKQAKNELLFLDNQHRVEAVPNKPHRYILGPPYVHYRRMREMHYRPEAKGTVAFPAHSTTDLESSFDWDAYAKKLSELPEEFQPVTACVYWADVLLDRHKYFEKYGIPSFTNGYMSDKDYIAQFYDLLLKHRYACSNSIGSYLFYAVEAGMPFLLMGEKESYKLLQESSETYERSKTTDEQLNVQAMTKAFSYRWEDLGGAVSLTEEQQALVAEAVGTGDWISPKMGRRLVMRHWLPLLAKKIAGRIMGRQ